jgi:HK97 gp10 family phage protein
MSLSYKAEGFAELTNWVTKMCTVMTKVPNDVMQQIVTEGVQYMQAKAPVDTGYMRANISGHVTGGGNAVITSEAYYSGFVNFGTRFMSAQPFFSDGIDYINGRIRQIMDEQVLASMRK